MIITIIFVKSNHAKLLFSKSEVLEISILIEFQHNYGFPFIIILKVHYFLDCLSYNNLFT